MHKPDKETLMNIEEILNEELEGLGENLSDMAPEEIAKHMFCGVDAKGALSYTWKGMPILDAIPEEQDGMPVVWRIFTAEKTIQ